jgi:hypothetical protein
MRSLAFTASGKEHWNDWAALCCACGLCTLYGCPEELYPKEACDQSKAAMRKDNIRWSGRMDVQVHPMREGRRVPIKSLMRKLSISEYDHPAHWTATTIEPARVVLPLKQSAGVANLSVVRVVLMRSSEDERRLRESLQRFEASDRALPMEEWLKKDGFTLLMTKPVSLERKGIGTYKATAAHQGLSAPAPALELPSQPLQLESEAKGG